MPVDVYAGSDRDRELMATSDGDFEDEEAGDEEFSGRELSLK